MSASLPFRFTAILIAVMTLTACSGLNSMLTQPDRLADQALAIPKQWQEPIPNSQLQLSNQLLDLIDDRQLTKLVEQTLSNNYDLRITAIRLQQQQLLTKQTDAQQLPELNLNLNSQRSDNGQLQTAHNLSLDMSWEVDVWGRLADQSRAENTRYQAQQQDQIAAANSLAARTIQSWLDITMRQQIIITENLWLKSLEDTETVIHQRYQNGLGSNNTLADLETARSNSALVRASIAARKQQQRDSLRLLAALQGKTGTVPLELPDSPPAIMNPPAQLPVNIVINRPDLKAALDRINAANAKAQAAHKQLLPSFKLSTTLSQSRPQLGDLLSGSIAWSLLTQLTAPLFDGGRLKTAAEIEQLNIEIDYLNYQQTLLNALNEVESALGQEASLAEQQVQLERALQHSEASLAHYRARYREGLNDIIDLLTAQQSRFSTRIQLLQTQQARLNNRITLGLALGMGV